MGEGGEDPDGKPSRRAKKRAANENAAAEMASEKRPRSRDVFLREQKQATKLAKVGPAGAASALDNSDIGEAKKLGKKTLKKMQVLATKQAKKEQSKSIELAKQHAIVADALTRKAKAVVPGRMKAMSRDLMAKLKVRTPQTEQQMLAVVAERISAKPEEEIELFDVFFELHATAADRSTKQLALLSAVAVFKDLVPGYRIREDRTKDTGPRNKSTLALEKHEMTILQTYRRMFPLLEAALKEDPRAFAPALSALVKAASDFNYQQRLIQVAVRFANSPFEAVRRTVGEGLQEMIAHDFRLEASRQLVLAIGGVAQAAASSNRGGRNLHPEVLHILLRLPVGRAEEAELHGDANLGMTDDADIRKGLQEGSIRHGVDKLRKGEAELLYEVFCVYLRILRQRGSHSKDLIAAALGGLAKWGQQVNLELLLEILKELKLTVHDAIKTMDEIVALQGLHCALVLLSGPAKALVTDATWIPDALTGALSIALPSLHSTHSEGTAGWPPPGSYLLDHDNLVFVKKELEYALEEASTPCLVLRTLQAAMACSHGFGGASDGSLAALLEQLGLLAAGADSHVSIAILKEASALLKKYRKLHTLLDVEGGLFGLGGITDRSLSIAWPLHVLSASLSPWPRKVGQNLAATVTSRRALISDIFPARDAKDWLQCEFPMHLAGLLEAPRPGLLPQVAADAESEAESEDEANHAAEEKNGDAPSGKGKGKGKKGAARGQTGNAPASGAISRKKRRRTTFWTETHLHKMVRSE